jgi:hypothetical protein
VPEIKDLTKKYPSDKLVVLSVSADKDDAQWREFVQKKKMDWLQYRDDDGHVLRAMGVHAFPTYVVIDTEGDPRTYRGRESAAEYCGEAEGQVAEDAAAGVRPQLSWAVIRCG